MGTYSFIVSSASLLHAVKLVSAAQVSSPLQPILENVLFSLVRDKSLTHLQLVGSSLEVELLTSIVVETAPDTQDFEIAVPAQLLLQALSNLPDQPVTFRVDLDEYRIELTAARSKFRLAGENGHDFPRFKGVRQTQALTLPATTLRELLAGTIPSATSDSLRPAMTALYLHHEGQTLRVAACDGNRLSELKCPLPAAVGPNQPLLVPAKTAGRILLRLLKGVEDEVTIEHSVDWLRVQVGNVLLRCRLVDERYPDYQNVIPVSNPNTLLIDRAELLSALGEVQAFTNRVSHCVRLRLTADKQTMSGEDLDFAKEAQVTLCSQYEGEDLEIGMNASLCKPLVASMPAGQLLVSLSTPMRAVVMRPAAKEESGIERLALLMPLQLNTYY